MFRKKNKVQKKAEPNPPPKKRTGMGAWFGKARENLKEKVESVKKHKMGALGSYKETPDEEYLAASAVFMAIEKCMISLKEATNHFESTLARYFEALETCGEHFAASSLSGPKQRDDRAHMTQRIFEQQNEHRAKVTTVIRQSILDPLDAKLAQMADVKASMEERRKHKKEYDYYFEKLRRLRLKDGEKNQEKIDRNEPKLEEAKDQLEKSSKPLVLLFLKYEEIRSSIVASEFEMFKLCQKLFYEVGSSVFGEMEVKEVDLLQLPTLADMHGAGSGPAVSEVPAAAAAVDDAELASPEDDAYYESDTGENIPNAGTDDYSPDVADGTNEYEAAGDDDVADEYAVNDYDNAVEDTGAVDEAAAVHDSAANVQNPVAEITDSDEEVQQQVAEQQTEDVEEPVPDVPDEETVPPTPTEQEIGEGSPAVALFDFAPSAEDELRLQAGQELVVLVQNEGGWWEGEIEGEIGLFPSNYVKLL